jgi:uncharacterized repeat protein (TIGR04076 family)
MKVFRHGADGVRVEVLGARGECAKGHKGGDEFILAPSTARFCLRALDAFIPYLEVLAAGDRLPWTGEDGKAVLRCPHTGCSNAEFTVERER